MTIKSVPDVELSKRIRLDNPWWEPPHTIDPERFGNLPKRAYFDLFFPYVCEDEPRRALILMGPRRVGKTVVLQQAIRELIDSGIDPRQICYLDIQTPLYDGIPMERLLGIAWQASQCPAGAKKYAFFDEVQYLPKWEVHLKNLVDTRNNVKFIASGSAAAALRLKSDESGAGRFTDFLMPPVTFYEYMELIGEADCISIAMKEDGIGNEISWRGIEEINQHFFTYLNVGGYPEAIFSSSVQSDMGRYIRNDIVDKVLMKDLPSLYGISDIQELNSLFTMLAYNTANEVSLDALSKKAGIAKNTIKRYIEYLESAFLIKILHRIDRSAKRFKKANFFKVYLTNPCIRCALFAPVSQDDEEAGHVVETAVFSQWMHSSRSLLYYARWNKGEGEVDLVHLSPSDFKPTWAVEVKWSDSFDSPSSDLASLKKFIKSHPTCLTKATSRTLSKNIKIENATVSLWPSAIYCYYVGWNIIRQKKDATMSVSLLDSDKPLSTS